MLSVEVPAVYALKAWAIMCTGSLLAVKSVNQRIEQYNLERAA